MTLYRLPNQQALQHEKHYSSGLAKSSRVSKLTLKPLLKRLMSCASSRSSTANLTQFYEKPDTNRFRFEMIDEELLVDDDDEHHTHGYSSIEAVKCCTNAAGHSLMQASKKKSTSLNTIDSYSSGFKSLSTSYQTNDETTIQVNESFDAQPNADEEFVSFASKFLDRLEININRFVRPILAFKILNRDQYMNLYQNIEKVSQPYSYIIFFGF